MAGKCVVVVEVKGEDHPDPNTHMQEAGHFDVGPTSSLCDYCRETWPDTATRYSLTLPLSLTLTLTTAITLNPKP